jgi:hypothetical protein
MEHCAGGDRRASSNRNGFVKERELLDKTA